MLLRISRRSLPPRLADWGMLRPPPPVELGPPMIGFARFARPSDSPRPRRDGIPPPSAFACGRLPGYCTVTPGHPIVAFPPVAGERSSRADSAANGLSQRPSANHSSSKTGPAPGGNLGTQAALGHPARTVPRLGSSPAHNAHQRDTALQEAPFRLLDAVGASGGLHARRCHGSAPVGARPKTVRVSLHSPKANPGKLGPA